MKLSLKLPYKHSQNSNKNPLKVPIQSIVHKAKIPSKV